MARSNLTSDKQKLQRKLAWLLYVITGFKTTLSVFGGDRQLPYITRSVVNGLIDHLKEVEQEVRKALKSL